MTYFHAGEPIHGLSASFLNDLAKMYAWWRSTQPQTGGGPLEYRTQQVNVYCRNEDTVDFGAYAPVAVSGFVIEPLSDGTGNWRDGIVMKCIRPSRELTSRYGHVGITQEPIPAAANSQEKGGTGLVCIQGVSPAKLQIVNNAHRYAEVIDQGFEKLISSNHGPFEVMAKTTNTGDGWALVKVGEHHPLTGFWRYGGTGASIGNTETAVSLGAGGRGYAPYLEVSNDRITAKRDAVGVGVFFGGTLFRTSVPAAQMHASLIFRRFNSSDSELSNRTYDLATWTPSMTGNRSFGGAYFAPLNNGDYLKAFLVSSTSETFALGDFSCYINSMEHSSLGGF